MWTSNRGQLQLHSWNKIQITSWTPIIDGMVLCPKKISYSGGVNVKRLINFFRWKEKKINGISSA